MLCGPVSAGEIPGLRPSLPVSLDANFELSFSNDFLGRGGSVDDFRTQQIVAVANFGNRWFGVLDHSVLTLSDSESPGRIDQLSASLGYRLVEQRSEDRAIRVSAGFGLRSVGDFAGERMQNGFHRLIGSDVKTLPYGDVRKTSATAWIVAEHSGRLLETNNGWRIGYWLRGATLATSDGQHDAAITALGTFGRDSLDLWTGLRQDWRSGYDEPVQWATAIAEEDLAFVLGLRFGSFILETVQQFDNDASWGQLRLVSLESSSDPMAQARPRLGLEFGFLLPDVHLHLAARWKSNVLASTGSAWSESIVVSAELGEPQLDDNPAVFIESQQLGIGLEWERPVSTNGNWISVYASAGAGWRRERLIGEGELSGMSSASVDRAVLLMGAGVRFHASVLGERWRYRIQTGISAWFPGSDAQRTIDALSANLQQPTLALSAGVTFEFD
jgi:hypothetical protein